MAAQMILLLLFFQIYMSLCSFTSDDQIELFYAASVNVGTSCPALSSSETTSSPPINSPFT